MDSRVLRSMQATAPFPPGSGNGNFCPISAQYPVVKVVGEPGQDRKRHSEARHTPDDASKRAKLGPGSSKGNRAVNDLFGRSGDARPTTDPSQIRSTLALSHEPSFGGKAAPEAQGLSVFTDIAPQMQVAEEGVANQVLEMRKASMLSMSFAARGPGGSSSLPTQAHPPGAHHGPGASQSGATGPTAPLPEFTAPQVVPYDWALKKWVRITCCGRFACFDRAMQGPASQAHRAQEAVVAGLWGALSSEEKWRASLLSWRHPDSAWEPEIIASLQAAALGGTGSKAGQGGGGAGAGGARLLATRLDAWRRALASGYMAVRHGLSSGLYVNSAEVGEGATGGSRHPVCILFTGPGTRGSRAPQALMSHSSTALRAKLAAAGLDFSLPLAHTTNVAAGHHNGCAGELQGGEEAGEKAGAGKQVAVKDGKPQSLLLFKGAAAVHGLFDWLIQDAGFVAQSVADLAADLPLLLAPVPFEGATLHQPAVKSMTMAASATSYSHDHVNAAQPAAQTQGGPGTFCHVLELAGPLPPWTLTRVCAALQAAAAEPCDVQGPGCGADGAAGEGAGGDVGSPCLSAWQLDASTYDHCMALNCWPTKPREPGDNGTVADFNVTEQAGLAGNGDDGVRLAGGSGRLPVLGGLRQPEGGALVVHERQAMCSAPVQLTRRCIRSVVWPAPRGNVGGRQDPGFVVRTSA
ncbi:hypothetical protein QJQ45_025381 [Haematococcus lacustris]|nr:hypothetical protein QJQ45_025381 [Haematococcus lacustris]